MFKGFVSKLKGFLIIHCNNMLSENYSMVNFLNKYIINISRQELPIYYRINGALYIVNTEYLMNTDNIYHEKSFAIVMSKEHSADIDNETDFVFAETLFKKSYKPQCKDVDI